MKYTTHRFRIAKPNAGSTTPGRPSVPLALSPPSAAAGGPETRSTESVGKLSNAACQRCRRLKKRCGKTIPECEQCCKAGQACSLADLAKPRPTSPRQLLQARIDILTRYIDESLPNPNRSESGAQCDTEELESEKQRRRNIAASLDKRSGSTGAGLPKHPAVQDITTAADGNDDVSMSSLDNDDEIPPGTLVLAESSVPVVSPIALSPEEVQHHGQAEFAASHIPLINAFFRHVHRAYPLVDKRRIMITANRVSDLEAQQSDPDVRMLYLVIAIGTTTLKRAGKIPPSSPPRFQVRYADVIQECLSQPGTWSVRILTLLALYSLFDPHGLSTWSIVGILTRQALTLGLTRERLPVESRPYEERRSPRAVELRRRLLWSVYILDRMMAVSVGQPAGLADEDLDVPQPAVTIEEYASADRAEWASALQLNRHIIHLRQLEHKILARIHLRSRIDISCLTIPDRSAIVNHLRSEIENWYGNGCLVSAPEADNVPIHNTITWLNARYYNLLILLYYPCQFNAQSRHISNMDLLTFVKKHIQYSYVLLSNNQLPQNRVTLNRLLPVCMVFLHCYASERDPKAFTARDEVGSCIEILQAFPFEWQQAHEAAHIMLQFVDLLSTDTTCSHPADVLTHEASCSHHGSPVRTAKKEWLKALRHDLLALLGNTMGKISCYLSVNEWNDECDMRSNANASSTGQGGSNNLSSPGNEHTWCYSSQLGLSFL